MAEFVESDPYPLAVSEAFSVRGQVVLVTGAAGWIGHRIAEAFAVNGARVVASDRPGAALSKEVERVKGGGHEMVGVEADLAKPEDLAQLVKRAEEWGGGRVDSLVHCGALPYSRPLMQDNLEDFDRFFHTNVRSTWLLARACVPIMKVRGGSIVNVASVNGHRPMFAAPLYTGTKAAVINMTQEMAVELAPQRIRVNTVSPGPVPNPAKQVEWCADHLHEPYRAQFVESMRPHGPDRGLTMQPMQVSTRPIDIAMAAIYLCSPAARVITGADILVDGAHSLIFPKHEKDGFWQRIHEHFEGLPENAWKKPRPDWVGRK